ncbi:hypothetical protein AAAX96_19575 [Butyricimonas faecihominis]|mgnify:FL=1|uniref:hypothetical protein n=1 Tax=Butyricimonas faecihominis TaxID=1472416 RepID=UPI0032C13B4F
MKIIEIILYIVFFLIGIKVSQLVYKFYPKTISRREKYKTSEYEYFQNRCVKTITAFVIAFGGPSYVTYMFYHDMVGQSCIVNKEESKETQSTLESSIVSDVLKEVEENSRDKIQNEQKENIKNVVDTNVKDLNEAQDLHYNCMKQNVQKDSIIELIKDIQMEHEVLKQAFIKSTNSSGKKKYRKKKLFNAYLSIYRASNIENIDIQECRSDSMDIGLLRDIKIIQENMLLFKELDTKSIEKKVNKMTSTQIMIEFLKQEAMTHLQD